MEIIEEFMLLDNKRVSMKASLTPDGKQTKNPFISLDKDPFGNYLIFNFSKESYVYLCPSNTYASYDVSDNTFSIRMEKPSVYDVVFDDVYINTTNYRRFTC
jgi:hypothetical protein